MLARPLLRTGSFPPGDSEEDLATTNIVNYATPQDAVDATPVGGRLIIPWKATGYTYTPPLVIDHAMSIVGAGVHELNGSQSVMWDSIAMPVTSPFLYGSVLVPDSNGANAIEITEAGLPVHLRDFGIRFATPYVGTGHGIVAVPPAFSSHLDNGLSNSRWDSITVYGHDGDHYAFKFANPILSTFTHLHSYGGGHLMVENDAALGHYGNLVFVNSWGMVYVGGSAHGVYLKGTAEQLNLMTFIRPQINVVELPTSGSTLPDGMTGISPATSAQDKWKADATVTQIVIVGGDFETTVGSGTTFSVSTTQLGLFDYP